MNADQPNLQVRGAVYRYLLQDYVSALRTVRLIRAVLFGLLMLCLLVPFATFGGIRWGLLTAEQQSPSPPTALPTTPTTVQQPQIWAEVARTCNRVAPFAARFVALLLVVVYLLAVNVCLSGRLGGASDSVVAFFWAVLLLLFLVPWHVWIGGAQWLTVFDDVDTMLAAERSCGQGWRANVGYYLQILLMPFIVLLTAVVADIRFGRCYREVLLRVSQQAEVTVQERST